MYAIIETGGKQYWVQPGETLRVEKLGTPKGTEITFDALWAVGDAKDGGTAASTRKAKVVAEILAEERGPKIIVFKRRSKKAYKKTAGHRQNLTSIRIKGINLS